MFTACRHVMLAFALVPIVVGCSGPRHIEIFGQSMGTTYVVKVVAAPAPLGGNALRARVESVLEDIDRQMSTYRQDSEISRLNRAPIGEWVRVSEGLHYVVSHALALTKETDGAFDVTVGRLVSLWGFGPEPATGPPSAAAVHEERQRVGPDALEVRPSPPALSRRRNVMIDLSAIAKGFAVDEVAQSLEEMGIERYLVEIGGELRVRGMNAGALPWRVGVQVPSTAEFGTVQRAFSLIVGAVATSGDYRNFLVRDGVRYSHTIDPRTGYPTHHELASVTVLEASAMVADALATALYVMGPERGMQYATRHAIAALFIIRRYGGFDEQSTSRFAELLSDRDN